MNKWVEKILNSPKRLALPIMTHPGIEMIGKTTREAVTDGVVHFKAIQALAEKYDAFGSTVIMDLTVEAEAFGATVSFTDHEIPNVGGRLVSDLSAIEALQIPSLDEKRVPEYLKANRLAVENISKPVFSGCTGPFTLAGRLYDMSEIMVGIYIEPEAIQLLLDKCTAFIIRYCLELKKLGAAGVIMAEPAAGLLSDEDCSLYSSVYVKKIVEAVQDEDFLVVLHNCGKTGQCTKAMIESEAEALHFGNVMDMLQALEACPKDRIVMGNLDPVGLFKLSASEKVYAETMSLLEKTEKYKNFVLSTGCDVPPRIPAENIDAFYRALYDFNA